MPRYFFVLVLTCVDLCTAGCPSGAVQGLSDDVCYDYNMLSESWYEAEENCQLSGGHLASVRNAFLNSFLLDKLGSKFRAESFWLGPSVGVTSTNWSWTDGSAFKYADWPKGML